MVTVTIAGLKIEKTQKTLEEKKMQLWRKTALFALLFILKSSLIMFMRQNVQYLHL